MEIHDRSMHQQERKEKRVKRASKTLALNRGTSHQTKLLTINPIDYGAGSAFGGFAQIHTERERERVRCGAKHVQEARDGETVR